MGVKFLSNFFSSWYPPGLAFLWMEHCFQLSCPSQTGISWILSCGFSLRTGWGGGADVA
ncbi:hypothetical protein [Bacteroides acidifaciens]|uniref:hypothetical protein n=1 Tax=Bacteroides acidifaciens TaxID=85831 RepID=UPI003014D5FB